MKDRLFSALKRSTADYAEIRFETEDSTRIGYRGKELDGIATGKYAGGIVRACTKGGWGIATFDSLDDLERKVEEACKCAALVGHEKTMLAETGKAADAVISANMLVDFRGISLDDKLKLIASYNDIVMGADPSIESSRVGYNEAFRTVYFASTRGAYFMEERPRVTASYAAVARDGSLVQTSHDGISSTINFDVVLGLEAKIEKTAKRAAALLKAPPCEGGVYTVVLDQPLGGVFAHEAFGHLSESDFLYENPKMRDLMHIGREMGSSKLNIVDDGSLDRLLGTQTFDDEGTPTQKTYLIKDGVLAGHLHSLETAAKMGEKPTGNARAIRRDMPPIVRMTNTYIEGGNIPFEELIKDIDNGIYACSNIGGQTMMEMFTFSSSYGYRIQNGKVGELIRDVTLTGNVFETLHNIDGFGNDFKILELTGGCGKNGQSPLPVTFGSPHLRIRNVVVGGK